MRGSNTADRIVIASITDVTLNIKYKISFAAIERIDGALFFSSTLDIENAKIIPICAAPHRRLSNHF